MTESRKGRADLSSRKKASSMKETGTKMTWKAGVSRNGKTERSMMGSFRRMRDMGMGDGSTANK